MAADHHSSSKASPEVSQVQVSDEVQETARMDDIRPWIGALFLLGSVLLGIQNADEPAWIFMAICGTILVLYPYGSGGDE